MQWKPASDIIPAMTGGERERRSMEKAVSKVSSYVKANHLLQTRELMVPNDASTEVYKRGLSLHQTSCPASLTPQRSGDKRDHHKGYAVAEPQFSVVPLYRGVNEKPLDFDHHHHYPPHPQQPNGSGAAFGERWPLLSPIVRLEPSLVRRAMRTPVKEAEPTPSPNEVYSTPPSRPISSTPVVARQVDQRRDILGEVPLIGTFSEKVWV